MDMTQKNLDSLRKTMHLDSLESIERPLDEGFTVGDTIRAETDDFEAVELSADREHLTFTLWDAVSKAVKNDKDTIVIECIYKDGCTLKEAGERIGVTVEMARQRRDRAMRKCRSNTKVMQIGENEGLFDLSRERKRRRERNSRFDYHSIWGDLTDEERKSVGMLV
jgi:DNA-directed RNA polymerase sigma subunit (sigma70/sigma32)